MQPLFVSATSVGEPVEDPLDRYGVLRAELAAFSQELAARPELVALTKADLLPEDELAALADRFEAASGRRPHIISAVTGQGVDALVDQCWASLQAMIPPGEHD